MKAIRQTLIFAEWLEGLNDTKGRAIILERIQRLARGLAGEIRVLDGGVSEMKIHFGPGYRVYFTERGGETVILLVGGTKRRQNADIQKAIELARNL